MAELKQFMSLVSIQLRLYERNATSTYLQSCQLLNEDKADFSADFPEPGVRPKYICIFNRRGGSRCFCQTCSVKYKRSNVIVVGYNICYIITLDRSCRACFIRLASQQWYRGSLLKVRQMVPGYRTSVVFTGYSINVVEAILLLSGRPCQ